MKIPIRIKILLLWYKIFYSSSKDISLIKISSSGKGVNNILFFLPSEKNLAQVVSHFIKRDRDKSSMYIKYIVHRDGIDHYQQIPNSNLITYSEKDLNWFGALKFEKINQKIGDRAYDALVDLNQSIDQPLSLIATRLDIPIKVGFSSPISDSLYTLVIDSSDNKFLENNYILIEKMLGLDK